MFPFCGQDPESRLMNPSFCPSLDGHAAETSRSCQLHWVSRSRNHPGPQPPGHALRVEQSLSPRTAECWHQRRSLLLSPLFFRALALRPTRTGGGGGGEERGQVLGAAPWELASKDWWGRVWKLVSPRYIYWPPLMTLGKRWFWVFFLDFVSQLKTPRLSGEGFRRHQKNLQQFLTDSHEQLWEREPGVGKSEGGRRSPEFLADPSEFRDHCQ